MHPTVTAFLDHLQIERNASPHTLRSYEDDLTLFCQFLDGVAGGRRPTRRRPTRSGCGATRPG